MQAQRHWIYVLATGLAAASPAVPAAEVRAGITVYAQDLLTGPSGDTDGGKATNPPAAAYAVLAISGDSMAQAQADLDARTGTARAKFGASVAADHYVVGRNAAAFGAIAMNGSIDLLGAGPPGLATFTALLEGAYKVEQPTLNNLVEMDYTFRVGDSPEMGGNMTYLCCGSGTFSIPFTWTQRVQSGDAIGFDLYLHSSVSAVAGGSELDASNTFKITGIDLPQGYTFTPDAQGFLSRFGTPVPEPASAWLAGVGLLGVLARARLRSAGAAGGSGRTPGLRGAGVDA